MKSILAASVCLLVHLYGDAQSLSIQDSMATTYFHIKAISPVNDRWRNTITGFILRNVDTTGHINWESAEIKDLEKDEAGYFVKANFPLSVINNSKEIWCTALYLRATANGYDTARWDYGGIQISNIKLILRSSPEGAETYLIPNRIWMRDFATIALDKDDSKIQPFRVNTSSTNTYAYVDQTVFVVLFKLNNQYKKLTHHTKPFNVEAQQTVWINF